MSRHLPASAVPLTIEEYVGEAVRFLDQPMFCVQFDEAVFDAFRSRFNDVPAPWPYPPSELQGTGNDDWFVEQGIELANLRFSDWRLPNVMPVIRDTLIVKGWPIDFGMTDAVLVPATSKFSNVEENLHEILYRREISLSAELFSSIVNVTAAVGWVGIQQKSIPDDSRWLFVCSKNLQTVVEGFVSDVLEISKQRPDTRMLWPIHSYDNGLWC